MSEDKKISLVEFAETFFSDKGYKIPKHHKEFFKNLERFKGTRHLLLGATRHGRKTINDILKEYYKKTITNGEENGFSTN